MGLLSEDVIAKANRVSILDISRALNLDAKKDGKSYHIEGYGGLYVSEDGSKWNCFSQGKGGGSIQFYMYMTGKSWRDSVIHLSGYDERNDKMIQKPYQTEQIVKNGDEMVLPKKAEKYSRLYAYLINTRKIDKDVVNYFVKEKMLYQEMEHGNAVFVGYDNDKNPKYATMRGTNTYKTFKGDVENSDKTYAFSKEGISKKVIVFESPVDLMSYMTLQKLVGNDNVKHHLLSLGGVTHIALDRYLKEHNEIDTIRLCLDNDAAGYKAQKIMTDIYNKNYKIEYEIYNAKDFNEYLKQQVDNGISEKAQYLGKALKDFDKEVVNDVEDFDEMEMQ